MKKLFFIFIFCFVIKASASHIVGGEIIYDDFGGGNYKITLKVYRDCNSQTLFNGQGSNLNPAYITVYDSAQNFIGFYDIGAPIVSAVPPAINNPCIKTPLGVCVEQGIYTYTLNLPPISGGYDVIYQVTFRNASILNIVNPGAVGSTYYTHIPGTNEVAANSSPRFTNLPPIFVCNGLKFTFDHSAIDPDGDQLVYSICSPFDGLGGINAPPPPYTPVIFQTPYSGSYPIASNPAFSINPSTGILSGTPTHFGQWVFAICVQEFRNNQLINTHYRDFQINVVPCTATVSVIKDQPSQCMGTTINFVNQSIGGALYNWDFGVPNLNSDTSHLVNPSYSYPDTGTYVVTLIVNPGNPCSDTSKKTFYVYPPISIDLPPNADQCLKGNAFNFSVTGVYLPQATFKWQFTSSATPSTSTSDHPSNITYSSSGTYIIKVNAKQFACKDSATDTIHIFGRPIAKINNLPVSLCNPANVAYSNGSSSDLPLNYYWHFSNGNNSTAYEPTQIFTTPGVYGVTLTVVTGSICKDTSIVSINNVTVNPTPKAGFTFSPQVTTIFDPGITIDNMASSDVAQWQYQFGDGTGSSYPFEYHIYQEYGDYVIQQTVANQFGCRDTLEQLVKILPEYRFWAPNAFTPDDNLLNDYFLPIAIGVVNYDFEIFDRWGERLFKTNNPKEGWNGFYKSQQCKPDVYAWRITFTNVVSKYNETHYGHVTLLRSE